MASVNGVSLKAVKGFRGHDGEPLHQGSVYIDGKKAGFFSNDSWGGSNVYHFDESELRARAAAYQGGFPKDWKSYAFKSDPDILIEDLLNLMQDERFYKKNAKEGRDALIVVEDGFEARMLSVRTDGVADLAGEYAEEIKEMKRGMRSESLLVRTYASLEDFDLLADADHPILQDRR